MISAAHPVSTSAFVPPTTAASPPPIIRFMAEKDFCNWVAVAVPRQRIEYFRGHLGRDRCPSARTYPEHDRKNLVALARRVLQIAEHGRVLLFQVRHGEGDFSYFALRTTHHGVPDGKSPLNRKGGK
jgi:hypothetical protein